MSHAVAIAADHGGFAMKSELQAWLRAQADDMLDLGNCGFDADDDYPDFADSLARAVASGQARKGILICGSGVGACIVANKTPGVRAGVCHDTYSARQGVEHDDMNVLCLGARVIGIELARELIGVFLAATFSGEERRRRRLEKVIAIEDRMRHA
ncbi:MAG: RpiB/LacA/LacB family sugar-phosphate isomerase [Dehalococcoidia bacterium]|nr:RpiB/LacA/LacB family sugar-phosphate isomerase [Dehalococcoidia bacterium]